MKIMKKIEKRIPVQHSEPEKARSSSSSSSLVSSTTTKANLATETLPIVSIEKTFTDTALTPTAVTAISVLTAASSSSSAVTIAVSSPSSPSLTERKRKVKSKRRKSKPRSKSAIQPENLILNEEKFYKTNLKFYLDMKERYEGDYFELKKLEFMEIYNEFRMSLIHQSILDANKRQIRNKQLIENSMIFSLEKHKHQMHLVRKLVEERRPNWDFGNKKHVLSDILEFAMRNDSSGMDHPDNGTSVAMSQIRQQQDSRPVDTSALVAKEQPQQNDDEEVVTFDSIERLWRNDRIFREAMVDQVDKHIAKTELRGRRRLPKKLYEQVKKEESEGPLFLSTLQREGQLEKREFLFDKTSPCHQIISTSHFVAGDLPNSKSNGDSLSTGNQISERNRVVVKESKRSNSKMNCDLTKPNSFMRLLAKNDDLSDNTRQMENPLDYKEGIQRKDVVTEFEKEESICIDNKNDIECLERTKTKIRRSPLKTENKRKTFRDPATILPWLPLRLQDLGPLPIIKSTIGPDKSGKYEIRST